MDTTIRQEQRNNDDDIEAQPAKARPLQFSFSDMRTAYSLAFTVLEIKCELLQNWIQFQSPLFH